MKTKYHPLHEDLLALFCGCLFVSLGINFFKANGLLSPGTAGLGLIGEALLPFSFGQIFFTINLPFYYLSLRYLGKRFTLKTFMSVAMVSVFTEFMPMFVTFSSMSIYFSSVVGGVSIGLGVLFMFRHHASLGGVGILAYYLQKRYQISAGKFQMGVDCSIVCMAYFLADFRTLIFSLLGAVVLNLIIAFNHKDGRYQVS